MIATSAAEVKQQQRAYEAECERWRRMAFAQGFEDGWMERPARPDLWYSAQLYTSGYNRGYEQRQRAEVA